MKTVFLHVGLPKTGSTSIQDFLFEQRDALEAAGILFPSPASDVRAERHARGEGWGRHASLLAAIQGRWGDLAPGEWDDWLADFDRFRNSPQLNTLILSHETIGNRVATLDLTLLRELFDGMKVRILLVVREAEAWLASLYEQRVAGRRRMGDGPDRFNSVNDYLRSGFESRIVALQAAFPSAEIIVQPFEALLKGDGLVPNTADLFGLPAEIRQKSLEAKRANISLSQEALEVVRRINASDVSREDFMAIRRAIATSERRQKRPKAKRLRIFSRRRVREIAERYETDRKWIEAEFGVTLPPAQLETRERLHVSDATIAAIVASAAAHLTEKQAEILLRASTESGDMTRRKSKDEAISETSDS